MATPGGLHSPQAGGVMAPADIQQTQRLRDVSGAQRESLKLGWRDQIKAWED